jgi:tetratricopeptide (TPR) repeat protein
MQSQSNIKSKVQTTAIAVLMFLIAVLSAVTFARNAMWHNPISLWKDTIFKSPKKGRPYHKLGAEFRGRRDFGRAMYYYKKANECDSVYFALQLAYQKSRQPDFVLADGIGHGSSSVMATLSLAEIYVERNLLDEAVQEYLKVLSLNQQQPTILNSLGLIYYKKGLIVEAANYFIKAILADPEYSPAYANLGFLYFKQGLIDLAFDNLRKAIKLDRRDPEPHFKLGLIYLELGRPGDALSAFESALAIEPTNAGIKEYQERASVLREELKRR